MTGFGLFVVAFVVGGLICVVGQLLMDLTSLTPAHVMTILVVAGAILGGLGWYEPLIRFAGAGVTVPITSFGNALIQGALDEVRQYGVIGLITGIFEITSAGISAAILFGFLASVVFRARG